MEGIKRPLNTDDDSVYDYNNNKKQKVQKVKPCFENLANETIYELFEYLDVYHIYQSFFHLNQRFQNLIIHTNRPIQINVSIISKSNLDLYNKDMIKPNKNRINYLRLSNPFTVDIILSPPRIICQFIQLETLVLDNIDAKYFNNILKHLTYLPKLQSLVLTLIDCVAYPMYLFKKLFRLPTLKSCKLTYQPTFDQQTMPIFMNNFNLCPIESLVINSRLSIALLSDISRYLPKLRYLSIDYLIGSYYIDMYRRPIVFEHLKNVSIKFDFIDFNLLEILIKYYFPQVEILRITTQNDQAYLDAKRWEKLILSLMPNLRIFDINHIGSSSAYHDLINEFNSPFWINKHWFFTHQHDTSDSGIFYSTNPYRRKDYTLYLETDQQICPLIPENNLNQVKHINICSKQIINTGVNYFPNVNELTIEHYFKTSDDSISTTLNRIIPLKQLTKLIIPSYNFPFEQIINLIRFTPNLHTLKLDLLLFGGINWKLIEQNEIFQYVSNTNKIKNLELHEPFVLENFQMIMNLFPKVEYLKTGMNRKQIHQIIRFLFSKLNTKTCSLLFLCISQIPKVCLRELNMLIGIENLINIYFIKYINRDLYLWW